MDRSDLNRREFQRLTGAALGGMLLGHRHSQIECAGCRRESALGRQPRLPWLEHLQGQRGWQAELLRRHGHMHHRREAHLPCPERLQGPRWLRRCSRPKRLQGPGRLRVPLSDKAWKTARGKFEQLMKAAGKQVGPAPPKKA